MSKSKQSLHGFTLIEILVVVAIMSLLVTVSLPLFNNLNQGNELRGASALILNTLQEAQQVALVRNSRVEVRFYEGNPLNSGQMGWDAIQYFIVDDHHQRSLPQIPKTYLPKSVMIHPAIQFSSLFDYQGIQRDYIKREYEDRQKSYLSFYFLPSGTAFLASTKGTRIFPFLTLVKRSDFQTNPQILKNFVTVQIDPLTGRIQIYK